MLQTAASNSPAPNAASCSSTVRSIRRYSIRSACSLVRRGAHSSGFAYQANYTYSKSIDIGCSGWFGVEGCSVTDPYHLSNSRGVSGFDLTHVVSISGIYDLPIGRARRVDLSNRFLNYALGNWQVNSIFLARSGLPYNIFVNADVANTGKGSIG